MPAPRPFALIRTHDQWLCAAHDATALLGEVVSPGWKTDPAAESRDETPFREMAGGLAFDAQCRLYRSLPGKGVIERTRWAPPDPARSVEDTPAPVRLFADVEPDAFGDFTTPAPTMALQQPRGLAVDDGGRLFVAETGARRVLIYDLWSNRLLRRVHLAAAPLDLATDGDTVYALTGAPAPGLIRLDARRDPLSLPAPDTIGNPACLALAPDGELFALENAGTENAWVISYQRPSMVIDVPFATDIEFQLQDPVIGKTCAGESHILVVARRPGEDFPRFCIGPDEPVALPPLRARGYDGRGIVRTPGGRIGFYSTGRGFLTATAARVRYHTEAALTTFRLDSGAFQTIWGRVFLDACIPRDTSITVRCLATDEPPADATIPRTPPANTTASPAKPELAPPLPPMSLARRLAGAPPQPLHRRETGCELPWIARGPADAFETWEAPVMTEPGRYLWLRLELRGTTRVAPRVRALRAEHPGHDYLRRLPRIFSREEQSAAFLQRYLAMFEGTLGELEALADARAVLLNPRGAPAEILPWLAGFAGMTLDERMARAPRPGGRTVDVRRTLIEEAMSLFRFRGTVPGLRRFLEIYLGFAPTLIEKYQVRGLGGAIIGDPGGLTPSSVLGAGFRVGGAIGEPGTLAIAGTAADAFATHAHRFTVVIAAALTSEQQAVVQHILDLHRPAHTLVDVCTVDAGMRVGRGLHVGLTSLVGRTSGFTQLQTGASLLGRDAILGRPGPGSMPGASRLGQDTRVG
ncbi:MAG: phage tail protein [Blastocatellia bacterium]